MNTLDRLFHHFNREKTFATSCLLSGTPGLFTKKDSKRKEFTSKEANSKLMEKKKKLSTSLHYINKSMQ